MVTIKSLEMRTIEVTGLGRPKTAAHVTEDILLRVVDGEIRRATREFPAGWRTRAFCMFFSDLDAACTLINVEAP